MYVSQPTLFVKLVLAPTFINSFTLSSSSGMVIYMCVIEIRAGCKMNLAKFLTRYTSYSKQSFDCLGPCVNYI